MAMDRSPAEIYGRDFPAGAVLFEEGDPGSRMYVIQSGRVRIEKRIAGHAIAMATLGPGEFFGEMALLEGRPRSASAVVDEPARILELDEEAFGAMVRGSGEVGLRLLRKLSGRLREADRQIRNFLAADVMGRAVEVLRALADPPLDDGWRIIPPTLDAEALAIRAGERSRDARSLWDRLIRTGLLRVAGPTAALAPAPVLDDFQRYLEGKPRYEAIAAGELAEVPGLGEDRVHGLVSQLLLAKLTPLGALGSGNALADGYREYVSLKRRFEVSGAR
jgi:CRP-like cAMP-binding protein